MSNFMPQLGRMTGNERASTNFGNLGGPDVRSAYVAGATNFYDSGVQNTNGFQTHHLSISLYDDWQQGDTVQGMPTFVKSPDSIVNLIPAITSYRAMSWPMAVYRLKYESEWRNRYGSHLSIQPFLHDWHDIGVQQTLELERANGCHNTECNFIIGGRARIPCVWHANSNPLVPQIAAGHQLYYIFTRHEYKGSRVMDKALWNDGSQRTNFDFDSMEDEEEADDLNRNVQGIHTGNATSNLTTCTNTRDAAFEAAYEKELSSQVAMKSVAISKSTSKVLSVKAKHIPVTKKEYYWSIDPWVSPDGCDPPPSVWSGSPLDPDNNFVGDYRYIGVVTHTLGGSINDSNSIDRNVARDALFPKVRGLEYRSAYFKLPCIEVMLGVKHGHTVSC